MKLALKELRETLVWLEYLERLGIGDLTTIQKGIKETDQLIRIFVASIATARRNDRALS
jgi:four helix bundle protein